MAGEREYSRKLGLSLRPMVNRRLNFSNYFNWSFDVFFSLIFSPVGGNRGLPTDRKGSEQVPLYI